MTLGSVPSEDRLPDSHHPRTWAVERTFNRQLQERSDIGLSPPPVSRGIRFPGSHLAREGDGRAG